MTEHINIQSQGKLPSEEELQVFEREIGIELPKSYRNFILTTNVKYIKEPHYNVEDKIYEISAFTTFGDGEWTLQDHYRNLREHFENRFIAFAHDSGGWQYVYQLNKMKTMERFISAEWMKKLIRQ